APPGRERVAGGPGSEANVPMCGNGRARRVAASMDGAGTEDIFPFLPQWISPTALLYTADGHIKRREGPTGPAAIVPFSATLHVKRAAYARHHRELQPGGSQRAMGIVDPAVSPDGANVAFTALGDLWLLPLRSASDHRPIQLTDDSYVELDPAWSPDGTKLVFSSDRGGNMDL